MNFNPAVESQSYVIAYVAATDETDGNALLTYTFQHPGYYDRGGDLGKIKRKLELFLAGIQINKKAFIRDIRNSLWNDMANSNKSLY